MAKIKISSPLTEIDKENLVSAAEKYIQTLKDDKSKNFSVSAFFAAAPGVTRTDWSYMANRNWDAVKSISGGREVFTSVKDAKFLALANACEVDTGAEWRHFDTDNYMQMVNAFEDSRHDKKPRCIDGMTGTGKSYAADHYRKPRTANTFKATCDGDMSAKDFMVEVAEACGVNSTGTRVAIRKRIVKKITERTDSPLLIIDEAENLKEGAYSGIKAMMDTLRGQCGIVLIGANNYEGYLKKKSDTQKTPFPQVYSRIKQGGFTSLYVLAKADVKDICNQLSIADTAVIDYLYNECNNMRELEGAVTSLIEESARLNEPITTVLCAKVIK